jgi:hypothetical protein
MRILGAARCPRRHAADLGAKATAVVEWRTWLRGKPIAPRFRIKEAIMRIGLAIGGFAVVLLAAGCCKSTQPLYTPETLKRDIDLAGTWEEYDQDRRTFDVDHPVIVKSLGGGEFVARCADANDPKAEDCAFVLRAVELEGKLYVDVTRTEPVGPIPPGVARGNHMIAAAQLEGDRLRAAVLDSRKVRKCATDANLHFADGWFDVILDATTADLQKFIVRYRDEIFEPAGEMRRIAKAPAAD